MIALKLPSEICALVDGRYLVEGESINFMTFFQGPVHNATPRANEL